MRNQAQQTQSTSATQSPRFYEIVEKVGIAVAKFVKEYYGCFVAPLIVMLLYLFALWQWDVFPFGKYTAASYDLSAQICPFIEHLFDVMQGKSTLTYTYALVGGVDVVGTFLYFFISPFSFLFLIFGDGKVAQASTFVMLFKLATIALAGTWFAKKLFKNIPYYLCVAIGITYTYCGYTFVANTYINWLDFLIYLPFCAGAFKHFVKTDNFWPFALLMSACIYTCFSIACFSMFIVFPTLVCYGVLCVEKEKKIKFIAYLCLAFAVAVVAALPVLLPALASYLRCGRGGGLFDNFWFGYTVSQTGELTDFNSSTFMNSVETALYRKWSYILADSAFVCLTLVWFVRKGLKDRFAKFMLLAGVFTLLPTVVDEAMLLMNMGSYMSYALRFGFLNALYFLGGACLCIEDICFKRACAYDGTPLFLPMAKAGLDTVKKQGDIKNGVPMSAMKRKTPSPISTTKYIVWLCVTGVIGLIMFVFSVWYVNNYRAFHLSMSNDKDSTTKLLNGFASSFAHSLGGFEVVLPLFILVAVAVTLGCVLINRKRMSARWLSFIMLFIVGTQVMFYNDALVVGDRSVQHIELADYAALCDTLNERDDGYFRVKDYGDEMSACAPLTGYSNSFSVFSSMIDKDNFVTYQLFAYKGNGKNSYKSSHNVTGKSNRAEEFGDSFLGYKYVMVPKSKLKEVDEKAYLKKVMVTDENGNQTHLCNDSFYVYENVYVFPLGYTVKSGEFTFVSPNEANATYRKNNQAALYEFLRDENLKEFRGHDKVDVNDVAELSDYLWDRAADVEVGAGKITAKVTAAKGEYLFLNFVASKGYSVTVNGKKAKLADNDLKFLSVALDEGENVVEFTYSSPYVKYVFIGGGAAIVTLCALAFVMKKTEIVDRVAPAIAWAGIGLAVAVVAVFMVYPTGASFAKIIELLKAIIKK